MRYCVFFAVFCATILHAVAPTSLEVTIAEILANNGIIVDHSRDPKLYRLGDPITRAEAVGVVLKAANIDLPDGYFCKNYFSDVRYNPSNNWICRAIEIATDYNILSRLNEYARPNDHVTRIEALAIVMRAGRASYEQGADRVNYPRSMPQWQVDLLEGALQYHVITSVETFGPNARASRMDVFGMAYNMFFVGKKSSSFPRTQGQDYYDFSSASEKESEIGNNAPTEFLQNNVTSSTTQKELAAQLQEACASIFLYIDCLEKDDPEYKLISKYMQLSMSNGELEKTIQDCNNYVKLLNDSLNKNDAQSKALRAGCWPPGSSTAQEEGQEFFSFSDSVPEIVKAGVPFDITIKALSRNREVMKNYTGSVLFEILGLDSYDPLYEKGFLFEIENQGVLTIPGIILTDPGEHTASVEIIDGFDQGFWQTFPIDVLDELGDPLKPLDSYSVSSPEKVQIDVPFSLTIAALDESGNVITGYRGTIFIDIIGGSTAIEQDLVLPFNFDEGYTFTSADLGKHTFQKGFTLKKAGSYTFILFELENDVEKQFEIVAK